MKRRGPGYGSRSKNRRTPVSKDSNFSALLQLPEKISLKLERINSSNGYMHQNNSRPEQNQAIAVAGAGS